MGISKPWVSLPQTMIVIGFFWPTKTHVHIHRNKETVMPVWDQDWPAGSSLSTNYIPRALCNSCVCWTFCWENPTKYHKLRNHTPHGCHPEIQNLGDTLWITSSEFQNKDYCTLIVFGQFQGSNFMRFASVSLRCDISKTFCRWQCETGWNRWNKAKWHCLNNQKETKETTME